MGGDGAEVGDLVEVARVYTISAIRAIHLETEICIRMVEVMRRKTGSHACHQRLQ